MLLTTYQKFLPTDNFLKIPLKGESINESKHIKLLCMEKLTQSGRNINKNHWSKVLPIFASFCTKKEKESTQLYRNASNLSATLSKNDFEIIFKELNGKTLASMLSSAKISFIITVIHNYLVKENNILVWKPMNPSLLRFTGPKQRGGTGGWAQEGLDFYLKKYHEENSYRKEISKKYKSISNRPDYFFYEEGTKKDSSTEQFANKKIPQEDYEIYSLPDSDEDDK